MIPVALSMTVTFAACTTGLLAIGLFARDVVFGAPVDDSQLRRRLSLAPQPPKKGNLDQAMFRLVEESGVAFDTNTALLLVAGCGVVGMVALFVLTEHLLLAAGGMLLGAAIPLVILNVVRWRRVSTMRKQLPDALQIIADAVHVGHTLQEALQHVANDVKGALSAEFAHAASQLELGNSPLGVIDRLVRRIPLQEFRVFAMAVLVHRKAGGNLSLLTERMARSARDRQEVRGHMLAATAGSRLSAFGMIVGSIVAMVVLAYLEPEYIGAFATHRLGPTLVAIAVCLQLVGVLWVWRLMRTNY